MSDSALPRTSVSNDGSPRFSLDTIGKAWGLVKSDLPTWVPIAAAALFVVGGILFVGDSLIEYSIFGTVLNTDGSTQLQQFEESVLETIPMLLIGVFASSLMFMGVKQARDEQVQFRDLFAGFRCLMPLLVAGTAVVGALILGFALFVIPGIYECGCLCFVPILVIDRKLKPLEAFKLSYTTMRPHAWAMSGLLAVSGLVLVGGFLALGVGVLYTLPIFLVTIGIAYNDFFPKQRLSDHN